MQLSETIHELSQKLDITPSLREKFSTDIFYEVKETQFLSALGYLKHLDVGLPIGFMSTSRGAYFVFRIPALDKALSLFILNAKPNLREVVEERLIENHGTFD